MADEGSIGLTLGGGNGSEAPFWGDGEENAVAKGKGRRSRRGGVAQRERRARAASSLQGVGGGGLGIVLSDSQLPVPQVGLAAMVDAAGMLSSSGALSQPACGAPLSCVALSMPQPPRPPRLQLPQLQLPQRSLEAQRSDGGSRGLPPGGSGSGASGCGAAAASFVLLQEVSAVWPADNDPDAYHDATVIGLGLSAGNELRVTVRYDGYEGDQAVLRPGQLCARGAQRAAQ